MTLPDLQRLAAPLTLGRGAWLPNRLAKAAMTEGLADPYGRPTRGHQRLYGAWARGGVGLMITGNVLVDRDHLERPGNVIIEGAPDPELRGALKAWVEAARVPSPFTGAIPALWMQISHAGRQTPATVNPAPKAPSAIPVALPGRQFGKPVAMSEADIERVIRRFAAAAVAAREAGFTGVQVHAAHGYLISSFLNPRANQRTDAWGGSLENRARLLRRVVAAVRAGVGADFTVSVKLNSADFQKGGFGFEDCLTVAGWLADDGVDVLELSGGSYEQPRMMNVDGLAAPDQPAAASTRAREAYFLDFAAAMLRGRTPPLMVTGGFRSAGAMLDALDAGVALIGLGRPLCADPNAPARLLSSGAPLERWEDRLALGPGLLGPRSPIGLVKAVNGFGVQAWYYQQLRRIGAGLPVDPRLGVFTALRTEQRDQARALAALRAAAPA